MNKLFLFIVALTFAAVSVRAQEIPADPAVRTGKLDNGLTYYIRSNAKPEKQAEFYILHNVGAIQEEDSQQGLAHFLEHMAFNGTKNLPDKTLINYLESVGVKFGANLNAFTAAEQTCYNMSAVPLNREGIVDTCLLILHDWSHFVTLDDAEIDNERGVIIEELRTRNTAGWRINEQISPVLYNHSKYAERNIIGSIEGLKSFSYQELKDFYHRWYRPDLQTVVIVGDFDAEWMEAKVKAVMSDIPAVENPEPKAVITVPDNVEPLVKVATDPEQTATQVYVYIKRQPIPREMNNTVNAYAIGIMNALVAQMASERLYDLSQQNDAPFLSAAAGTGSVTTTLDAAMSMAVAREGESQRAFEALYAEIEKIRRFGFNPSEMERAQSELMSTARCGYNNRDDRRHSEFVNVYLSNFRQNTPMPAAELEWQLDSTLLSALDLNTINLYAKDLFKQENQVIMVMAPRKEGVATPTEQELLAGVEKIRNAELQPYEDNTVRESLIPEGTEFKGSPVVKESVDKFGATLWTLGNGARVLVKENDYRADELRMMVNSLGGFSAYAQAANPAFPTLFNATVRMSGVGRFKATELNKVLAGINASFTPNVTSYMAGASGSSSIKDAETMFQLMYLYFTQPRWGEDEFKLVEDNIRTQLRNAESNPDFVFSKELSELLYNGNPRRRQIALEDVDKVDFDDMARIYSELFDNAGDFVFILVGNMKPETLKPLVEKYIGSLPTRGKVSTWTDDQVRMAAGEVEKNFEIPMQMPKSSVAVVFNGPMPYTMEETLKLNVLAQLLRTRYTETIREEKGGTYGVSVQGQNQLYPANGYLLLINFDTNKEMAAELTGLVKEEIAKMAQNGPTEEELAKIKEYLVKQRKDTVKTNGHWLGTLNTYYTHGVDTATGYDEFVNALTPEQIRATAAKILADGNVATVTMNPKEN